MLQLHRILLAAIFVAMCLVPAALAEGDKPANEGPPYVAGVGDESEPVRISTVPPKYPKKARKRRIQTKVILQALINEKGHVDEVEVLLCKDPGHGFEKASFKAVKQWEYEPAMKDGVPVPVFYQINIDFNLK